MSLVESLGFGKKRREAPASPEPVQPVQVPSAMDQAKALGKVGQPGGFQPHAKKNRRLITALGFVKEMPEVTPNKGSSVDPGGQLA